MQIRKRPRRTRKNALMRRLVRETRLSVDDLVMPFFVVPGAGVRREIKSMPGNFQLSIDELEKEAARVRDLGIGAIMLFGVPDKKEKDAEASAAVDESGLIPSAVRSLKKSVPNLLVATDVCLCAYTDHGHCGVVEKKGDSFSVANDRSVEIIAQTALVHARAGADIVAPSDMMDARIGRVRDALEAEGMNDTVIMSYAAKYASAFYEPFRDAAESPPAFGDRSTYQMDPANAREALREIALDIEEGADIVMVKPALPYLDVISGARDAVDVPLAAYCVSGEFAMVKAAAAAGMLDEKQAALEILHAIKRAGADIILTYWAPDAAAWL